jgi:hypothetical protein
VTDFAPDAMRSFFGRAHSMAETPTRPQTNGACERAEEQTPDCGSRSTVTSEVFPTRVPALWQIFDHVCAHYDVSLTNLRSACRRAEFVRPRHVAMYLAKQLTTKSFPQIGLALGDRDHTSVLYGVQRIEALMRADPDLARDVDTITRNIRCGLSSTAGAIANDNAAPPMAVDLRPRATKPRPGFWTENRIKKLREMWVDGATDQQCATYFDVARSTIRLAVAKNDIRREWP